MTVKKEPIKKEDEEKKEFVIDALDIHGSFFHKKCIEVVSGLDIFHVIEKEFPVELDKESTKIDIVAERDGTYYNSFIIECKKVDNDFKTWVFLPDIKHGTNDFSVLEKDDKSPLVVDAMCNINYQDMAKEHKLGLLRYFINPKDSTGKKIDNYVCYDGYQIKFDMAKDGKINRKNIHKSAKKDDIERACNQALLGSRGYALHLIKKMKNAEPLRRGLFIPIIVTTAKLFVCNIESDNINLKKGTSIDKEKIKLENVPWLVYNYKPNFILKEENQVPFISTKKQFSSVFDESENDSMDYIMSVYIVNSEKLNEFLDKMQWVE